MSVPEQTPYKEYIGNGVTKNFALEFTCDSKQELKVFIDNVEPELSTWSLVGGSVVFTTAPSSGSKIVLKRATKLERTTNYSSTNNSFRPESINNDLDRVWYALQDQAYKVGQYDYDYNFVLNQVRPIQTGGTGADNATSARDNLNVYSKGQVDALIATGGQGSVVPIDGGGTGATNAEDARTNLGVYSQAEVDLKIDEATPNASETVAGKAKIATTAIARSVVNDTDFLTPKKLRDAVNATHALPIACLRSYAYVKTNGSTVTVAKSLNVASVVRGAAGTFTVTFNTPMPDTNYLVLFGVEGDNGQDFIKLSTKTSKTVNSFSVVAFNSSGSVDGVNFSVGVVT